MRSQQHTWRRPTGRDVTSREEKNPRSRRAQRIMRPATCTALHRCALPSATARWVWRGQLVIRISRQLSRPPHRLPSDSLPICSKFNSQGYICILAVAAERASRLTCARSMRRRLDGQRGRAMETTRSTRDQRAHCASDRPASRVCVCVRQLARAHGDAPAPRRKPGGGAAASVPSPRPAGETASCESMARHATRRGLFFQAQLAVLRPTRLPAKVWFCRCRCRSQETSCR
jgi:hypothetical protein